MKVQIIKIYPSNNSQKTSFGPKIKSSSTPTLPPQELPPTTLIYPPFPPPFIEPIKTIQTDNIHFGYKSVLKSEWLKGNMPTVEKGIYGGVLTKKNITLEHIVPHSKGGKTELPNLALAVGINNWERSNKPFSEFFDPKTFNEYLEQFKDVDLPNFNGLRYIEDLTRVVKRVLKNEQVNISDIPYFK